MGSRVSLERKTQLVTRTWLKQASAPIASVVANPVTAEYSGEAVHIAANDTLLFPVRLK